MERDLDLSTTNSKIHAMRKMGVPYPNGYEAIANDDLKKQATAIADNLKQDKIEISSSKEIIAVIAYLQRLGTDIKVTTVTAK
jgi:cytochrome c oxidase cbb3-type subunit I/II